MFAAAAADVERRRLRRPRDRRATARHVGLDVAAELRDVDRGGGVDEHRSSIDNIGLLVTNDPELGEGPLGLVRDAALVIEDGRVAAVEPAGAAADERFDAGGRCVIPGFVDSHTHLVFAGDRADEFAARMAGRAVRGGRDPGHDRGDPRGQPTTSCCALARARRRRGARAPGSPTSRSSPATGSTVESRGAPAAEVAAELTDDVTFLGAHVVPPEYEGRADDYVELVCGEMLAACAPHARWIDVFCERGAFDADQSRAVLAAGRDAGLGLRVHGNQLGPGPGVAARRRDGRRLGRPLHLPRRRRHRGAGRRARRSPPSCRRPTSRPASPIPTPGGRSTPASRVAIATNTNPGSSYTTSMAFCIALAVRDMRMTIDEALRRGDRSAARGRCAATTSAASPPAPAPTRSSSTRPPTPTWSTGRACRSCTRCCGPVR